MPWLGAAFTAWFGEKCRPIPPGPLALNQLFANVLLRKSFFLRRTAGLKTGDFSFAEKVADYQATRKRAVY